MNRIEIVKFAQEHKSSHLLFIDSDPDSHPDSYSDTDPGGRQYPVPGQPVLRERHRDTEPHTGRIL